VAAVIEQFYAERNRTMTTDHVNDESQQNGNEGIRTGSVRLPRLLRGYPPSLTASASSVRGILCGRQHTSSA
jgi:hypothetical protein